MNTTKTHTSSLKQLQAIEKSSESVNGKSRKIKDLVQAKNIKNTSSRAVWALRWLLKQLQKEGQDGIRARQSDEVWDLFRLVIDHIPLSSLAQLLQQNKIHSIVAASFEDCCRRAESLQAPTRTPQDGKKRKATGHESSPSKRRKADGGQVLHADGADQAHDCVPSVFALITRLHGLTSPKTRPQAAASRDFLRSVLRPDPDTAQKLLSTGSQSLLNLITASQDSSLDFNGRATVYLQAIIDLWRTAKGGGSRFVPHEKRVDTAKAEKSMPQSQPPTCANVPILLLVCVDRLRAMQLSQGLSETRLSRTAAFENIVEHFLAKYFVVPLKNDFLSRDHGEPISLCEYPGQEDDWSSSPFQSSQRLARSRGASNWSAYSSTSAEINLARADMRLLTIAIECSTLDVARRRASDMTWIKSLFHYCLALFEGAADDSREEQQSKLDFTMQILGLAEKLQVTFDDGRLAQELARRANLIETTESTGNQRAVHWALASRLAHLFPTFLVPSKQPSRRRGPHVDLLSQIMTQVSASLWQDAGSSAAQSSGASRHHDYQYVRDNLLSSIILAFRDARAQIEFLSIWHEQLGAINVQRQEPGRMHDVQNLLEDPHLIEAIASGLGRSLPLNQKLEALDSLAVDEPAGPAFVVLESLLRGTTGAGALEVRSGRLASIISRSTQLLDSDATTLYHVHYLRVCSTAMMLWCSIASVSELQDALEGRVKQPFQINRMLSTVAHTIKSFDTSSPSQVNSNVRLQAASAGLSCFALVLSSLEYRNVQLTSNDATRQALIDVSTWLSSAVSQNEQQPLMPAIAEIRETCPVVLSQLEPRARSALMTLNGTNTQPMAAPTAQENAVKARSVSLQKDHESLKREKTDMSVRDQHARDMETSQALEHLPSESCVRILHQTLSTASETVSSKDLKALQLVAKSRSDWAAHMDLSPLVLGLCQCMIKAQSFTSFDLCATTLTHMLQLKNIRLTQSAIEGILAAVTGLLSPQAPSLGAKHARMIYKSLAHLLQILLARNTLRKRLRGRMHLLLAPIQALDRCLFSQLPSQESNRLRRPPWIADAHQVSPLVTFEADTREDVRQPDAKCAAIFSRILMLLVDPPHSAVSASSASRNKPSTNNAANNGAEPLNDPTAEARQYASYFAPLILSEHANCLLRGRYSDDGVRKALQPGVNALLEVVSRNGIGIDALGSVTGKAEGAREVMRSMVSEWRRTTGQMSNV